MSSMLGSMLFLACSVCYGEPGNPLTEGARAGVLVLGAIILGLMGGFIGVIAFWSKRAREIDRANAGAGDPPSIV